MVKLLNIIRNRFTSYNFRDYRVGLMVIAIILGVIGALTLYYMPGMPEKLYLKQLIGVAGGIGLTLFVSLFDYRFIAKFWIPMYILNLVLLAAVKFTRFGIGKYGAVRWLGIKDVFSFQPSELSKVIMIIVMAKLFQYLEKYINKFWVIFIVGVAFAIPTFLIFKQPDLSTTIVFVLLFAAMLFTSGYNIKVYLGLIAVAIPLGLSAFWYIQQPSPKFITSEQQRRVLAYLHPEEYVDDMYQQLNSVSAISSGGLIGKQLANDTNPRGTLVVPVTESDFIFTGVCEEFGFLGAIVVIVLLLILALMILNISRTSIDLMGKLIAVGCATIFITQTFVNVGVVTLLLPNTGIPLPFVSNGLSSTLSSYIMLGLVQNIAINHSIVINKESEDYIK